MKHAPLHVLAGRAVHSAFRHSPVFGAALLLVIAAEGVTVVTWHSPAAYYVASAIFLPLFVTVVYAFAIGDVDGSMTTAAIWSRVLERAWAVIVIDLLVSLVATLALLAMGSTDLLVQIFAIPSLLLSVTLVFADVHAVATRKAEPWWMLIPRSFAVSVATALGPDMLGRAFLLAFVTQFLPSLVSTLLQSTLEARHVSFSDFWAFGPLSAVIVPPLGALVALVYLDATGYESEHSRL
jgi:hypothetical protein